MVLINEAEHDWSISCSPMSRSGWKRL